MIHFNLLCYDLEQLDSLPDREKVWRGPDEAKSLQLLKQAAQKGSATAAFEAGKMYENYSSKAEFNARRTELCNEALIWYDKAIKAWNLTEASDPERLRRCALSVKDLKKLVGTKASETLAVKHMLVQSAKIGGWWDAAYVAMYLSIPSVDEHDKSEAEKWMKVASTRAREIMENGSDMEKHRLAVRIKSILESAHGLGSEKEWNSLDMQLSNSSMIHQSPSRIWTRATTGRDYHAGVEDSGHEALEGPDTQTELAIRAVLEAIDRAAEGEDSLNEISQQMKAGFCYKEARHFLPFDDNARTAVALLSAAARLGHYEAAFELSYWAFNSTRRPADNSKSSMGAKSFHEEAEKWCRLAAEAGCVEAQLDLAHILRTKSGFDLLLADASERAFKYLHNENTSTAKDSIQGTGRDLQKTIRIEKERLTWLLKAAKQGSREAQVELLRKADEDRILVPQGFGFELQSYTWGLIAASAQHANEYDFKMFPAQARGGSLQSEMAVLSANIRIAGLAVDFDRAQEVAQGFIPKQEIVVTLPHSPIRHGGSGTGFFISPYHVVTNAHVVIGWQTATIQDSEGVRFPAKILLLDEVNDLALLSSAPSASSTFLGLKTDVSELAEEVFTIGFPNPEIQGTNAKYTDGKISSDSGLNDDLRFYQTTVPVQPGNSGGPLIDSSGEVIGVMTARLSDVGMLRVSGSLPQSVSYAIKAFYVAPLVIKATGQSSSNQNVIRHKLDRSALVKHLRMAVVRVVVGAE